MRTRAGISTSEIHFTISKMVSAVRADATEVPVPKKNPLAQTVYPLQGRKVDPNFENQKKISEKISLSLCTEYEHECVYKVSCAALCIKKALGIFRELITTRTTTTRVAFWDPPSGSKNVQVRITLTHGKILSPVTAKQYKKMHNHSWDTEKRNNVSVT